MKRGRRGFEFVIVPFLLIVLIYMPFQTTGFAISDFGVKSTPGDMGTCQVIDTPGNYIITQDLSVNLYCINVTTSNVLIDGRGHNMSFDNSGEVNYGIVVATGNNNITIKNFEFNNSNCAPFSWSVYFEGVSANHTVVNNSFYMCGDLAIAVGTENVSSSNISYNNFTLTQQVTQGFSVYIVGDDNKILNNRFSLDDSTGTPVSLKLTTFNRNNISQNYFYSDVNCSLDLSSGSSNHISNNVFNSSGNEITLVKFEGSTLETCIPEVPPICTVSLNSAMQNSILENNSFYSNGINNILIDAGYPANNIFLNNNFNFSGSLNYTIYMSFHQNLTTLNQFVYNNSYGEIKFANTTFLRRMLLNGTLSFPGDLNISSNFAGFNVTNIIMGGINDSSNVTIYGLSTNMINPYLAKNGVRCTDCYNFTSLNAGTVVFNVSSWSNYSILENNSAPIFYDINASKQACEDSDLLYLFKVYSVETDTLNLTISTSPSSPLFALSPTSANGPGNTTITLLGVDLIGGPYELNISANDGRLSNYSLMNVSVISINDAPTLTIGSQSLTVGSTLEMQINSTDEESGNQESGNLTFNISQIGTNVSLLSINGTGYANGTFSTAGTYTFTTCVNDTNISNIDANISLCGQDGLSQQTCANFSVTVSATATESGQSSGGSSGGGSGGAAVSLYGQTYSLNAGQLEEGYSNNLRKGDKYSFGYNGYIYTAELTNLGVDNLRLVVKESKDDSYYTELVVGLGDARLIDIEKDGYYDFEFEFNKLENDKANITIRKTRIAVEQEEVNQINEESNNTPNGEINSVSQRVIVNILLILGILLVVIAMAIIIIKRRNHRR